VRTSTKLSVNDKRTSLAQMMAFEVDCLEYNFDILCMKKRCSSSNVTMKNTTPPKAIDKMLAPTPGYFRMRMLSVYSNPLASQTLQ